MDETLFSILQQTLLSWFASHGRHLPWRQKYTPYAIWIAEIMLQQTQMERGVHYFRRWMARFPNIASVAAAEEDDLLKAWEGLGYYQRARNIQAAARIIMRDHGGIFPADHTAICALPGIGPYTAGAIASTAFNQNIPCVDGNVERVLSRLFDIATPVREEPAKSRIHALAAALIPAGKARNFNQSLMELGALVCRKKPCCSSCPVSQWCRAHNLGIAEQRPVPGLKQLRIYQEKVCGVLQQNATLLIHHRPAGALWGGLWEFPGGDIMPEERPEEAIRRAVEEQTGLTVEILQKISTLRHSHTSFHTTLHCFLVRPSQPAQMWHPLPPVIIDKDWRWIATNAVGKYPMPAPHRKLAEIFSSLLTVQ